MDNTTQDQNSQTSNKSSLVPAVVIVVVLVVIAGLVYYRNMSAKSAVMDKAESGTSQDSAVDQRTENSEEITETVTEEETTEEAMMEADMKFTIDSANFTFSPNLMKVKKGDKVQITLNNKEGFHDLKIDEFNLATKKINGPGTETVQFTADKVGTFEYYCSVGTHRQMGMVGKLIVE